MKTWIFNGDWLIESRKLEDEWLVFHGGDARTHRLTGLAAQVFEFFRPNASPLKLEEIHLGIETYFPGEIDAASLEQALQVLAAAQLLKSVESF